MAEPMLIRYEKTGKLSIGTIFAAEVLDAANVVQFGREVLDYIKTHAPVHLLLDFEKVAYLSSAVLTELLKAKQACEETGGAFRLCALNPRIREVFEITGLDKVFIIEEDLGEAARRFRRSIMREDEERAWEDSNKDRL